MKPLKDIDSGQRMMAMQLALKAGIPLLIVFEATEAEFFREKMAALFIPTLILIAVILRLAWHFLDGTGNVAGMFLMPDSVKALKEYSEQDALIAHGKIAEAIDSYHNLITVYPADLTARLRLAALLADDPATIGRAERCFLDVRRLNPSVQQEWIAGNGLIDLYHASGQRAKLKVELTRLADRYAATDAGKHARRRLGEIEEEDQAQLSK